MAIIINNKEFARNNIVIKNNRIFIDGQDVTPTEKEITITITGNVGDLSADVVKEIHVNGNVGKISTVSGDVFCNSVTGNVETTSGDVDCENIHGNVETTSGDVSAGVISGTVKTVSGDIKYRNNGSV